MNKFLAIIFGCFFNASCSVCEMEQVYSEAARVTALDWKPCDTREFDEKLLSGFALGMKSNALEALLAERGWIERCPECLRKVDESLWVFSVGTANGYAYEICFSFDSNEVLRDVYIGIDINWKQRTSEK